MLRNWRNVAKQLDTILDTWVRMDTSESDSPAVGLPHLPEVSWDISAPVPKCSGHFGTKYRCRSVLGLKCPGAEVSVKLYNNGNIKIGNSYLSHSHLASPGSVLRFVCLAIVEFWRVPEDSSVRYLQKFLLPIVYNGFSATILCVTRKIVHIATTIWHTSQVVTNANLYVSQFGTRLVSKALLQTLAFYSLP